MADDRGEKLKVRLAAIAGEVPGIETAARNTTNFSEKNLPALAALDGDEEVDQGKQHPSGKAPWLILTLLPEFYVQVQGTAAEVGPLLSGFRAEIINRVRTDATLQTIVTADHGKIRYLGYETDLGVGRMVQGQMLVKFALDYPQRLSELV